MVIRTILALCLFSLSVISEASVKLSIHEADTEELKTIIQQLPNTFAVGLKNASGSKAVDKNGVEFIRLNDSNVTKYKYTLLNNLQTVRHFDLMAIVDYKAMPLSQTQNKLSVSVDAQHVADIETPILWKDSFNKDVFFVAFDKKDHDNQVNRIRLIDEGGVPNNLADISQLKGIDNKEDQAVYLMQKKNNHAFNSLELLPNQDLFLSYGAAESETIKAMLFVWRHGDIRVYPTKAYGVNANKRVKIPLHAIPNNTDFVQAMIIREPYAPLLDNEKVKIKSVMGNLLTERYRVDG